MGQEELPALISFLYKDEELARSFSAQLFSGLLKEVQEEFEDQDSKNYKIEAKIPLMRGDLETAELSKSIKREVLTPHDVLYLELLTKLNPYIKYDLSQANFGDLVSVKGDIFFFSPELMRLAIESFVAIIQHDLEQVLGLEEDFLSKNKKKKKERKEMVRLGELIRKILDIPQASFRYVMFTKDDVRVSGFIKPNFLTIPYNAVVFNYGANPIPNVVLVGIYETTISSDYSNKFYLDSFDLASYEVLKAFAQLRKDEGYTVRPLVIYYTIPLKNI